MKKKAQKKQYLDKYRKENEMETYDFLIVETLTRVVEVEGEDLQSAQDILNEMIRTEEVVLDADDFEGRTIIPL